MGWDEGRVGGWRESEGDGKGGMEKLGKRAGEDGRWEKIKGGEVGGWEGRGRGRKERRGRGRWITQVQKIYMKLYI